MPVYRRRRHLLLTVAAGLLFAQVATASEPSNAPNITEPRNAAAGFAITLWMVNVDALGDHCSKLASPMSGQFLGALKAWQERNAPYVNAALEYMADIEDYIKATQGEAVRKQFRADRKAEFVASAQKAELVWFPDRKLNEVSCLRMARHAEDGSMDLDQNAEFFPILQAMKAETGRKGEP